MPQDVLAPPSLALVACSDVWMSDALETSLEQHRFTATQTRSASQTIKLAHSSSYDIIVIDDSLEDMDGILLCRALRDSPAFDHSTPMIVTSLSPRLESERLRAYAEGAWEYCSTPLDFEAALIRLPTFLRPRQMFARLQAENFLDPATGLYSSLGLRYLASQIGAIASRKHEPIACLAFSAEPNERLRERVVGPAVEHEFADVAALFKTQSRKSDILGRMRDERLAIVAPNTDAAGARRLVARLQRELDKAATNLSIGGPMTLRAGYSAVDDLGAAHIEVEELVSRAEIALERTPRRMGRNQVINFDDLPPN
jgi:PleD family two-component response regulator